MRVLFFGKCLLENGRSTARRGVRSQKEKLVRAAVDDALAGRSAGAEVLESSDQNAGATAGDGAKLGTDGVGRAERWRARRRDLGAERGQRTEPAGKVAAGCARGINTA